MLADGLRGEIEPHSNVGVAESLCEQHQHFRFAPGQAGRVGTGRGPRSTPLALVREVNRVGICGAVLWEIRREEICTNVRSNLPRRRSARRLLLPL
jgi:hypothetical protein